MADHARFVIDVDHDGRSTWELVDQSNEVRARGGRPFPSLDEARADVERYRAANAAYADAEIQITGSVPNV